MPIWAVCLSAFLLVFATNWYHFFYDEGVLIRSIGPLALAAWLGLSWDISHRSSRSKDQ